MVDSFAPSLCCRVKQTVCGDLSSFWLGDFAVIFLGVPVSLQDHEESESRTWFNGDASVIWHMGLVFSCGDDSAFELPAEEKWF